MLIQALSESYRVQLWCYTVLHETAQRLLSRLILSRGDLSCVKSDFAEKQQLLERIETERQKTKARVSEWQERKALCAGTKEAVELDGILQKTETAIKKFLEGETQLEQYLAKIVSKQKERQS
jgi:hypothetical protein